MIGEVCGDLRGALEVQPAIVPHPVDVGPILSESDAEQHVVGVVVLAPQEVRVVRRDDGESQLGRESEDLLVELALPSGVVGLDLQVIPAGKRVRVPTRGLAGRLRSRRSGDGRRPRRPCTPTR